MRMRIPFTAAVFSLLLFLAPMAQQVAHGQAATPPLDQGAQVLGETQQPGGDTGNTGDTETAAGATSDTETAAGDSAQVPSVEDAVQAVAEEESLKEDPDLMQGVEDVANPFPNPRPPSTRVRITILDKNRAIERGTRVGVLIGRHRKRYLESKIGMKVDVTNISSLNDFRYHENVVYYRPGFMHAAMLIAREIPGAQNVAPMERPTLGKEGIDLEVVLGDEAR